MNWKKKKKQPQTVQALKTQLSKKSEGNFLMLICGHSFCFNLYDSEPAAKSYQIKIKHSRTAYIYALTLFFNSLQIQAIILLLSVEHFD